MLLQECRGDCGIKVALELSRGTKINMRLCVKMAMHVHDNQVHPDICLNLAAVPGMSYLGAAEG